MSGIAKKFDKSTWKQVVRYVRLGLSNKKSAQAACISEVTFYDWVDKGSNQAEDYPEHAEFYEELTQAQALFEVDAVEAIQNSGELDWKAHAFLLERRNPEDWGKRPIVITDWEEEIQKLGLTPEEVKNRIVKIISEEIAAKQAALGIGESDEDTVKITAPPPMDPPLYVDIPEEDIEGSEEE